MKEIFSKLFNEGNEISWDANKLNTREENKIIIIIVRFKNTRLKKR